MSLTVVRGATRKPVASSALVDALQQISGLDGYLYIGYPILGSADGRLPIDALLITPDKGLIVFDIVEGSALDDYEERQDDSANKLEAKLRNYSGLVDRRKLAISLRTMTFAPAARHSTSSVGTSCPVARLSDLEDILDTFEDLPQNRERYGQALSALQNISSIRQARSKRTAQLPESRGSKLQKLEDSIATLDTLQSKAVIETVDGVQRIRGLAGSGKTIVLALKAAYLHAQYPSWRIGVTFNTRSLKGQFRRLINSFCIAQTGEEPDWEQIRVVNAWGAPGGADRDGLYYEFCRVHEIPYYDFLAAKQIHGSGDAFRGVCAEAIAAFKGDAPLYDVILVDEAQDFPAAFLNLCYSMLTPERRLVYAYDELQNLGGTSVLPPEILFGNNPDGSPRASMDAPTPAGARRDIILEVCYRNSRPVLSTAHALGFGIYRPVPKGKKTGLVQMFDVPTLWTDIGYRVESGDLEPGHKVTLARTPETSPLFLENHSPSEDLIQFHRFTSTDEQARWLADAIAINLERDELRHDDIIVINPDPLTTRAAVGPMRALLHQRGIESHLAGVTTSQDVFFMPDERSITFTGIYRAKGNEAGMVYIINAQDCHSSSYNLARIRNQLFTAITRSKAWVRVLGVGNGMDDLISEFTSVCRHNFELAFRYPTDAERQDISIVHRDLAAPAVKRIEANQRSLSELIIDIDKGVVHIQDLDPQLVDRLKSILGSESD